MKKEQDYPMKPIYDIMNEAIDRLRKNASKNCLNCKNSYCIPKTSDSKCELKNIVVNNYDVCDEYCSNKSLCECGSQKREDSKYCDSCNKFHSI